MRATMAALLVVPLLADVTFKWDDCGQTNGAHSEGKITGVDHNTPAPGSEFWTNTNVDLGSRLYQVNDTNLDFRVEGPTGVLYSASGSLCEPHHWGVSGILDISTDSVACPYVRPEFPDIIETCQGRKNNTQCSDGTQLDWLTNYTEGQCCSACNDYKGYDGCDDYSWNKKTKDCYLFSGSSCDTNAKGFYTAKSSSCNVAYGQAIAAGTHQAQYRNSSPGECCFKCKDANRHNAQRVCDEWMFNKQSNTCDLYRSVTKHITHSDYIRGSSQATQQYPKHPQMTWHAEAQLAPLNLPTKFDFYFNTTDRTPGHYNGQVLFCLHTSLTINWG